MGTTGQSITLANSIIGVGILAMPFCFQQCGILLATLILLFMGLISRLCCYFLLKSALLARRRNFEFLAFHVFGPAGKLAVEVGIIGFLMGTCIAYFVVVGDLGPQIVAKMFNINQSDILRTSIMVLVSLVCVLPLGLLQNVDSLSNVSAATIAFYFCLVIKLISEAAYQLMAREWHSGAEMWRPAGLLQCVPIFSMALFCQTQLFEIFESLPTLSLEKMNVVTKNAINICTCVYFTLGVFGYIAFSSHDISGNILMSLSPTMASDVIKLGFVMSVAFSFPLIIFPCRASLYSLLYKKVHSSHHDHIINNSIPKTTFRCITVAIVAVSLCISLLIPNIELVLGLVGSTIGVLICVVFPAACFVNVTFKNTNERVLAKGVLILGLVIMVLGTYANLQAAENSRLDRYEEKYTQERIDKIVEDFFENRGKKDFLEQPLKTESLSKEPYKLNNGNLLKDSEVQPPNPVPPESQSNEKLPKDEDSMKKGESIIVNKPIDSHPKDIKSKMEERSNEIRQDKLSNGNSEQKDNKESKLKEQSKSELKLKPKDTKSSNEDKIDIMKQEKLIETIKQHGEEQKELIKEQKEILDEIIKTKKELQQNKNEVDPNEAKKIAVESIKQIANMAIQSLGGVTEKPDLVKEKETIEKLTNDAVQEIAKKAAETIEAIKDIKNDPQPVQAQNLQPAQAQDPQPAQAQNPQPAQAQNPQPAQAQNPQPAQAQNPQPAQAQNPQPAQAQNPQPAQAQNPQSAQAQKLQPVQAQNVQQNVQSAQAQNLQPVQAQNLQLPQAQNLQAVQAQQPQVPSFQNGAINSNPQNLEPNKQQIQNNNLNSHIQSNLQNPPNVNGQAIQQPQKAINQTEAKPLITLNNPVPNAPIGSNIRQNIQTNNNIQQNVEAKVPVINKLSNNVNLAQNNINQVQNTVNGQNDIQVLPNLQSQPRNAQVPNIPEIIAQNVPLPIVNNLLNQPNKKPVLNQNEFRINKVNNGENVPRQKREVIDCTQKVTLKPEDKQICDTLVDLPNKSSGEILPNVDLNDVGLRSDLNVLDPSGHFVMRSLQSIDEEKR